MDHFDYRNAELHAEQLSLTQIAEQFGTPCYVYSRQAIEGQFQAYQQALAEQQHLICYSVKANSNLAVLNLLARLGAGFDIVSIGELERVLAAGGEPAKVIFSGVGKQVAEMERALQLGIHCFNVESEPELERLNQVAGRLGKIAPISLRINPDVDAQTHPYISTGLKDNKFGIDIAQARAIYQRAARLPHLKVTGVDCHIGSQLTQLTPFLDALQRLLALIADLRADGHQIEHLDIGGGLGVRYNDETPPTPAQYMDAILPSIREAGLKLLLEPGRSIVANAGVLLTRVEYLKPTDHKNFCIVDAAMNDLLRPALYSACQPIVAVKPRHGPTTTYDVVGPICETSDFLGKERELCVEPGDLLAIQSAGAYGFSMSSSYNSRPRAAEVMVDANQSYLVRARETLASLFDGESLLP